MDANIGPVNERDVFPQNEARHGEVYLQMAQIEALASLGNETWMTGCHVRQAGHWSVEVVHIETGASYVIAPDGGVS